MSDSAELEQIIEVAPSAIFIADPERMRIVYVNRAGLQLTGYRREELLEMSPDQLLPPEDVERGMEAFAKALTEGGDSSAGWYVAHKDGSRIPVDITTAAVTWRGKLHLTASFHDARERQARQTLLEREARQLATLNRIARQVSEATNAEAILGHLTEPLRELMAFDSAGVALVDHEREEVLFHSLIGMADGAPFQEGSSFPTPPEVRAMLELPEAQLIRDVSNAEHPLWRALYDWGFQMAMGAPLITRKKVVGVLGLGTRTPGGFTEDMLPLLQSVADLIAPAMDNARLLAERDLRVSELALLNEVARVVSSCLDVRASFPQICDAIQRLAPFHRASVAVFDDVGAWMTVFAAHGAAKASELAHGVRVQVPPNLLSIVRSGKGLILPDLASLPDPVYEALAREGIRCVLVAPLTAGDKVIGIVSLGHRTPELYTEPQLALLCSVADILGPAVVNAELHSSLQQLNEGLETRVRQRTFELSVLNELSRQLGYSLTYDDLFELMLTHLHRVVDFDVVAGLFTRRGHYRLVVRSERPLSPATKAGVLERLTAMVKAHCGPAWQGLELKPNGDDAPVSSPAAPAIVSLASLIDVGLELDPETDTRILLVVGAERSQAFSKEQSDLLRVVGDRAGESVRRLRSLLAAEERRVQRLVEQVPEGILVLDQGGNILLANPAAYDGLRALGVRTFGHAINRLGDRSLRSLAPATEKETEVSAGKPHEIAVAGPPAQTFEVRVSQISTARDANGWLILIRDTTEERLTQRKLEKQGRLAAVGQLAAGIAHDFNNLLTVIVGFAELNRMREDLPDEVSDDLGVIIEQARRATLMVKQVMDFGRQTITHRQPLHIQALIAELRNLLERTIREDVRLVFEVPADEISVNADPIQLQQVLINLALNSQDAMPAGGEVRILSSTKTLTADASRPFPDMAEGEWVVLQVVDTGSGMPQSVLERAFDPFFTTKAVGQGTGLGLAQAYGIVRQHGGHLSLDSSLGHGTTASVWLPALRSSEPTQQRGTGPQPRHQGQGERVLIVEDEPSVLMIVRRTLQSHGYQVLVATNGREALDVFEQEAARIDLVLSDLTMPEMGGIELFQTLRARGFKKPLIIMSGYVTDEEQRTNLHLEITGWVQKPATPTSLVDAVSKALRRYSGPA